MKRIVIAPDTLSTLLADGLDDLCLRDWEEIEGDRDRFPYAPDWDRAFLLERQGILKPIGARIGSELIGYSFFYLTPLIHSKAVMNAYNDVIYLAPEHRRGLAGARLIREAERHLRRLGANRIVYAVQPTYLRTGALLEKMGYRVYETVYVKVLA